MNNNENNGGYPDGYLLPIRVVNHEVPPGKKVTLDEAKAFVAAHYGPQVPNSEIWQVAWDAPFETGNNLPGYESQPENYDQYGHPICPQPMERPNAYDDPYAYTRGNPYSDPVQQQQQVAQQPAPQQGFGFEYRQPVYQQPIQQYQQPVQMQQPYGFTHPIIEDNSNIQIPSQYASMYPQQQQMMYQQPQPQMYQPQPQYQPMMDQNQYQYPSQQYSSGQNQYDPTKYGKSATPYADPMYGKTDCSNYGGYGNNGYTNNQYGYGVQNSMAIYEYNQYMNAWDYDLSHQMYIDMSSISEQEYRTWNMPDPFEFLQGCLSDEVKEAMAITDPATGFKYYTPKQLTAQQKENNEIFASRMKATADFQIQLYQASQNVLPEEERLTDEELRINYDYKARNEYFAKLNKENQKAYGAMTPEQIEYEQDMQTVENTAVLHYKFMNCDRVNEYLHQKQIEAVMRIKESHNRILGAKPGEEVTLEQYIENFPFLYVDALMREQRIRAHDKKQKYDEKTYVASLAPMRPGYSLSSDMDNSDYVPMPGLIKKYFDESKEKFVKQEDGSFNYVGTPPPVPPDIKNERDLFLGMACGKIPPEKFL